MIICILKSLTKEEEVKGLVSCLAIRVRESFQISWNESTHVAIALNLQCHKNSHYEKRLCQCLQAVLPFTGISIEYSHFSVFCIHFQCFTKSSILWCVYWIPPVFSIISVYNQNSVKELINPYTWRHCYACTDRRCLEWQNRIIYW